MTAPEKPVFESFQSRITALIGETEQLLLDTSASQAGSVSSNLLASLHSLQRARVSAIQRFGPQA